MGSHTVPPALMPMGVSRDALDDIRETGERMLSIFEEYRQKLVPFDDIKLADPDVVKEILINLPPDKASILTSTLIDVAELVPPTSPGDAEQQIHMLREYIDRLHMICTNLHTALDGEAP